VELPSLLTWILVAFLSSFSIYIISMNFTCVFLSLSRGKHHSIGPLLGGGAGSLATLLCPLPEFHSWAWVPLVVDPGCLFMALALAYSVFAERRRT